MVFERLRVAGRRALAGLGKYFNGTETDRFWREQERFYDKEIKDREFARKVIGGSKAIRTLNKFGKVTLNLAEIVALGSYVSNRMKNPGSQIDFPIYVFMVGEAMRIIQTVATGVYRRRMINLRKDLEERMKLECRRDVLSTMRRK